MTLLHLYRVEEVLDTQIKLKANEAITQCEQCGRVLCSEG